MGIYYILYDLLAQHIYGAEAVLTGDQTLVLTLCATMGALFCIGLPFYVVYRAMRVFI